MSIQDHISKLEKEASKAAEELELIKTLSEEFPDLSVDTDRWGRKRYKAKSANPRVTDVMYHKNCGCCADSPYHARPYLNFGDVMIFSDPCNVMIGEFSPYDFSLMPYGTWEEQYTNAGINPVVIEKIKQHIKTMENRYA